MSELLNRPIEYLKGVGPQRGDLLKKELGIFKVGDLISHFPFRYVDRTKISTIDEIDPNTQYAQLKGVVTNIREVGQRRGKRLIARLKDDTGTIELVWFKGLKWIKNILSPNTEYVVFGKPSVFNRKINIVHPEIESIAQMSLEKATGLQPIYPSTEKLKTKGLDSRGILKLQKTALEKLKESDVPENLPQDILRKYKFVSRYQAVVNIHLPKNNEAMTKARKRLKFEELFLIQLRLLRLKLGRKEKSKGFLLEHIDKHFKQFYKEELQFELTNAQKRVLKEIRRDVLSGTQMNRLLQGDVGSGKTVVALMTMLMAIDSGYQACLMAPTEILAQQHYKNIQDMLGQLDIKVALLTGSVKGKVRQFLLEELAEGNLDIVIGTHALIEDKVQFHDLGLVVIDEQHRFGVAQRAKLWEKNKQPPHILVMTATPIPRTLAMTVYGDLDTSVIDELPPGRKPVKTIHIYDSKRLSMFDFLKKEIAKGRQVYIVYPLIQESETMDYKDLQDGYESIVRAFPPPDYKVSIVHGQMKSEDKEFEMQRFVKGETDIMVATTVIEVGVDVPNASVMVIESAERFGLSQLHQLRGRVGRGAEQSFCILMSGHKLTEDGKTRLQTMVRTNDGFEIAEVDMRLRGPGDLEGTQQSGILSLKVADIMKDSRILNEARYMAQDLLEDDPELQRPENKSLRRFLEGQTATEKQWSKIS